MYEVDRRGTVALAPMPLICPGFANFSGPGSEQVLDEVNLAGYAGLEVVDSAFHDHSYGFDAFQRRLSRFQGSEPAHQRDDLFERSMI